MIRFEKIKSIILSEQKKSNHTDLTNEEQFIIKLCEMHSNELKNLVLDYINDDEKIISLSYFRFFYFFYIQIAYVDYGVKITDKEIIKNIFKLYLLANYRTVTNDDKKKAKIHIRKLYSGFNYLYKKFFKQHNVYYSIYFNNLIKYFLPLPYDMLSYYQYITFRSNVDTPTKWDSSKGDTFYKKNNTDYLDKIQNIDTVNRKHYVQIKNVDAVKDEIDIHVPIKYFSIDRFKDSIFLIASKETDCYKLYIAKNLKSISSNEFSFTPLYYRCFKGYNFKKYVEGLSFEFISPKWINVGDSAKINRSNIIYISVMRKIQKEDLFNFFKPISFPKNEYKYLFHNTKWKNLDEKCKKWLLERPSFMLLSPEYYNKYFVDRNCVVYKIDKNIDNLIDLTMNTTSRNKFTTKINEKYVKDKKDKRWKFHDNKEILKYYENKDIDEVFNVNNKCVYPSNIDIKKLIADRPYCDINDKFHYVGRRKLQEIVFKTRKYSIADIYIYTLRPQVYEKFGYIIKEGIHYDDKYYNNEYKQYNIEATDYDILVLKDVGVDGFFFTDYDQAIKAGGEILLVEPKKFLSIDRLKMNQCNEKPKC